MTDKDFKRIQDLIKQEIRSVKELVEVIKTKVDKLELFQNVISEQVRNIKDQQSVINEKLDSHTGSLMNIEATIAVYSNAKKLEKRIEVLEAKSGTNPPPEFTLANVQ